MASSSPAAASGSHLSSREQSELLSEFCAMTGMDGATAMDVARDILSSHGWSLERAVAAQFGDNDAAVAAAAALPADDDVRAPLPQTVDQLCQGKEEGRGGGAERSVIAMERQLNCRSFSSVLLLLLLLLQTMTVLR